MAIIETIKQRIRQLDGGAFQSLCDAFLEKERQGVTFMSLGSHAGTMKTTRGTPDTYYVMSNGNYVFIEYTTQDTGVAKKIREDLDKCFDEEKTKVPVSKIFEVVYCHTSSNISPGDDFELRQYCESKNVVLTLFGIDQLALRLHQRHHDIISDYLNISIGTGQIKEYEQFIRDYDANKLAAPLATDFNFREAEIQELNKKFEQVNVIVLVGRAGVGKSRLALHYARSYSEQNKARLLCIRANALPIYEDLKRNISIPGKYFILVDDANELSGLQYVLNYATNCESNYDVKILITVRDYAARKVVDEANAITDCHIVNVMPFSDDQIKTLSENHYGIKNELFLSRIAEIAKGNARIAMLAGKIALDTDKLESISDLTDLFANYYGRALEDQGVFENRKLLICAGLVSYLSPFAIDRIESLQPIFEQCGITIPEFGEYLYDLHEKEIIQIHFNQVVRFEEQCLSNYVLKLVFVDKKYISISKMAKACLDKYFMKTIEALNTISGVFQSESVHSYIEMEIRALWDELEQKGDRRFHEFVKSFYGINQVKALLYVQNLIEKEVRDYKIPEGSELVKAKKVQQVDDILSILGGFADTQNLETALDLYFEYYKKCCSRFGQFYYLASSEYNVAEDSARYGYYTQRMFVEKLLQYSEGMTNEPITTLFFELAVEYLKFEYSSARMKGLNTVTFYTLKLRKTRELMEYRLKIWNTILTVDTKRYCSKIIEILNDYARTYDEESREIICDEAPIVIQLIETVLIPTEIKHCLIVARIRKIFNECGCLPENAMINFKESYVWNCYKLLDGVDDNIPYEEREKNKKGRICKYLETEGLIGVYKLIDLCKVFADEIENTWRIQQGLRLVFELLSQRPCDYLNAIQYYVAIDTPLNVRADEIVYRLLQCIELETVRKLIFESDYSQKNAWQFAYFSEMPDGKITRDIVRDLYVYLQDGSDAKIQTSGCRDICIFDKYRIVDENVFIKACSIVCQKFEYSPFVANAYFSWMFNENCHSIDAIMKLFVGHYDLLAQIYVSSVQYSRMDDLTGEFLIALYRVYPAIMQMYIACMSKKAQEYHIDEYRDQLYAIYELEDAEMILDSFIEEMIQQNEYPFYSVKRFLETILTMNGKVKVQIHQDAWIKHFIEKYPQDKLRMECLFCAVAQMTEERKIEYVRCFLHHTQILDDFRVIFPMLHPTSWSGSAVPMYSKYRDYLMKLLPYLQGIKFIQHKAFIEDEIAGLQRQIEKEQMEDILKGYI